MSWCLALAPEIKPILLIAESANPEWVSVPLVGWNQAVAIAKCRPVVLVTQIRNQAAIKKLSPLEFKEIHYINSEAASALMARLGRLVTSRNKGWTTLTAFGSLAYYYFEYLLWKQFGERIRGGEFSLVHRVVPLSPTAASLVAVRCKRAGVPFILGPLNGGVPWPKGYLQERLKEKEWLSFVRGAYQWMPYARSTLRHAAAIIVGSTDTQLGVRRQYRAKTVLIPENGIHAEVLNRVRPAYVAGPIRCSFIGRLVPYKGADMVLQGLARHLLNSKVVLTIVGDGPERPELEALSARLGVAHAVDFVGWAPQQSVFDCLMNTDLFCFPSVREFGGGVVVEAMAHGAAPLVVAYAGPNDLVGDNTGWKVPIGPKAEIIASIDSIVEGILANPGTLENKKLAARDFIGRQLTWEAKARQVTKVYDWVLKGDQASSPPQHFSRLET